MTPAAMYRILSLPALLLLSAAPLPAEVVVSFGAVNYTTSGAVFGRPVLNNEVGDFDGDGSTDDVRDVIPFSDSAPLSPTAGWAASAPGAVFHGGIQVVRLNAATVTPSASFTTTLNQNDPNPDRVRIGFNTSANEAIDLVSGVLLWAKPGFLGDFATERAVFAGGPSDGVSVWFNNVTNAALRLVLRQGETYYASRSAFGGAAVSNLLVSLNGATLADERWARWDPATLRFIGTTFEPVPFNNLTAVGVYFESARGGGTQLPAGQNFNVTLDSLVLGADSAPATAALTLVATNGTIVADPALPAYPIPTDVELAAFPATGYVFSGWSGALSGFVSPASLRLEADATVEASFLSTASYSGWIVGTWGPGPSDATVTGPGADPDGDGLVNLLEFALGLSPTSADGDDARPQLEFDDQRHLVLVYERPVVLAGVTYAVDVSDNGSDWSLLSSPEQIAPLPGGRETVRVRDDRAAPSQSKRYLRLRVSLGDDERSIVLSGQYLNVIAYEGFAYPEGSELTGLGGTADGWGGAWRRSEQSGQPLHVAGPDALVSPLPLERTGGSLAQTTSQPGDNHIYRRTLSGQPATFEPEDTVWFSILVRSDQADTALKLRFLSASDSAFGVELKRGEIRAVLGDQSSPSALPIELGAPVLLAGRLDLGGPETTLRVWKLSDLSAPPVDGGALVRAPLPASALAPESFEIVSTRWKGSFALDEITLADSFEAAVPAQPQP